MSLSMPASSPVQLCGLQVTEVGQPPASEGGSGSDTTGGDSGSSSGLSSGAVAGIAVGAVAAAALLALLLAYLFWRRRRQHVAADEAAGKAGGPSPGDAERGESTGTEASVWQVAARASSLSRASSGGGPATAAAQHSAGASELRLVGEFLRGVGAAVPWWWPACGQKRSQALLKKPARCFNPP